MTDVDYADFVRTGPGTLAGRYLRRFWQPMYRVQDLTPGRAVPIRILGEDFTLYRAEGGSPHVVAFRCAHRGAQLSVGWVEGDCIRCRYHGWKYDPSGQCVEQPGEDESFAAKVKIRSYPTQEYLGLIFAYFGEGAPPPIRRLPDFEDVSELAVGPPQLWPCNYFNRIDNACDPLHVAFTHRVALGRVDRDDHLRTRGAAATVSAEETDYGVKTTVLTPGSAPSYLHFHMPNTNQLGSEAEEPTAHSANDARSPWGDRMFWRVPVDDTHCVSFLVGILRLPSDSAASQRRRQAAETVMVSPNDAADAVLAGKIRVEEAPSAFNQRELFWVEDYVTEVGQGPIADRTQERLGQRDVGVALLRSIWRRELKALAEGRPLKQWTTPSGLLSAPPEPLAAPRT